MFCKGNFFCLLVAICIFLSAVKINDIAKACAHTCSAVSNIEQYTRSENRALQCAENLVACDTSNKSAQEADSAKKEALKALQSL